MKRKLKLASVVTCALMGVGTFTIADAASWDSGAVYTAGDTVTHNGKEYTAKYWTQNNNPENSGEWGPWSLSNGGSSSDDDNGGGSSEQSAEEWSSSKTYTEGDTVTYNGGSYTAKWWTQGETPNPESKWGVWQYNGEAEQGTGTVSIVLPAKPDFVSSNTKADVQIFKNGVMVAESKDANWGSTTSFDISVGSGADLTVSVPSLDGATGSATPASFNLAKDASQTVSVEYTAPKPAEEGSININAKADVIGNPTTTYTLTNSDGVVVFHGDLNVNNTTSLNSVPASEDGVKYTLEVAGFTTNGYNYTPSKTYSVTVYNYNSSNVNVNFDKKAIPTENVTFSVDGLPSGKSTTLTLTNGSETKEVDLTGNSASIDIAKDGSIWTITAAAMSGYKIAVSPSSFTADQSNQNVNVKITENAAPSTNWPDRAVVGYVRGYDAPWYSQPDTTNEMIQTAMDHGYNVIVYAFAGQDSNGTVTLPKWTDEMKSRVPAQLDIIHSSGGIALLSIGGAVNYFDPNMSGDNAIVTGKAMGKFLAENGYDGLDIDVEHPNASSSVESNFIRYIDAARAEFKSISGKDMYLAAAPQISGNTGSWDGGNAKFAEPMYTQDFLNDAHFDAIFIQTYNQYGGAAFFGKKGFDVGFLSNVFKLLSEETRPDMEQYLVDNNLYVPEGTKIVLGVPDFKDPSVSEAAYKQGTCLADASCSGAGLYDPKDISTDITNGGLGAYNQYGGVMTWILNSDSYQGWTWVDGVKGVAYN
ncbi:chitinase [Candidatus Francisella endociliophora]|uniref:Chitinase n=1 Tax=Candidatus Francisella endociliophora TaxID=653937 RepID=A0A097ER89_9GAMM|nr:glycosyl hydrolase family 18 protein [Francisella sp. FSC1006]AIT10091.1 chitinase [Francisella sp. FSC1006]